jgi:hypothetical protein
MTPISDDMVERACIALVWAQINDAGLHPDELEDATPQNVWDDVNPDDGGHDHETIRKHVRAVLTAALEGSVAVPVDLARAVAERDHWRDLVPRADRAQFPFDADALPRNERGGATE